MADEARMEIQDSDINSEGDKTPENEDVQKAVDDLPSEDEDLKGDKGQSEGEDDKSKPEEKKVDRSEIAQKIKWRERYQNLKKEVDAARQNPDTTPEEQQNLDDKEKQARAFLKKIFREEYETVRKEEQERESVRLSDFDDAVDEVLEDNPDIKESQLLDVVEEFEVEPKIAVKIIKKWEAEGMGGKPKPKMPTPKRAQPGAPKEKSNDAGKTMYQVAQDVIKDFKSKFNG